MTGELRVHDSRGEPAGVPRACLTCRHHDKIADCENPVIHQSILSRGGLQPLPAYFNPPIDFHCSLYELDAGNPELTSISEYVRERLKEATT